MGTESRLWSAVSISPPLYLGALSRRLSVTHSKSDFSPICALNLLLN